MAQAGAWKGNDANTLDSYATAQARAWTANVASTQAPMRRRRGNTDSERYEHPRATDAFECCTLQVSYFSIILSNPAASALQCKWAHFCSMMFDPVRFSEDFLDSAGFCSIWIGFATQERSAAEVKLANIVGKSRTQHSGHCIWHCPKFSKYNISRLGADWI